MDLTILQPPSDYPDEWFRTDFDHFATLQRGKDLTRDHFRSGSIPVAGSNGIIGYHDTANVKGPGITVGRSGSVGKVAFYQEDFWAHNTALFVKDFHGNVPAFTAFFLNFLWLGRFGSGASVPTLDRNVFRTLPVVIPPPCEQQKIADVLGLVQRAIEQQDRLIALTTELKKALLHKLFTEGLRSELQKQTEIGPVPESWEIAKLGSLVNLQTGKLNSNAATLNGEFPFFTCSQETFRIDHYAFDTEAILLSGNNAQGIYSVKHYKGKFNAYQRTYVFTLKDEQSVSYPFLHHALSRNLERLRTLSIGTSTKYLTLGVLQNLPIPKPQFDEAERIGEQLQVVEKKIESVARKKTLLGDLFRTMLHQLMTAQIRVHNLDLDEILQQPASEIGDGLSPKGEHAAQEPSGVENWSAREENATSVFSNRSNSDKKRFESQ